MNLHLGTGPRTAEFPLRQTPTEISYKAMAGDAYKVYCEWLDAELNKYKPNIHPRASNAQRKVVMSSEKYREWIADAVEVGAHKAALEAYLMANPTAKWSVF